MWRGIAFAVAAVVISGMTPAAAAGAPEAIVSLLKSEMSSDGASGGVCGRRESALRGTLARLESMSIPTDGKLILVNIASRSLAAYENGKPVIESRVVIGKEGWRTPDMSTTVDYVRVNPTWTVPESIVKANRWRARLASDPAYFARNGFDVVVRGRAEDPRDIDRRDAAVATFVQRPAKDNALGRLKIGLVDAGGIYLHDTNDRAAYDRKGIESHGCIRVEAVRDLAAWILGRGRGDVDGWISDGDRENRKPAAPVRVVVGYFTAWPDGEGKVHFYSDIYKRDQRGAACRKGGDEEAVEEPYGRITGDAERGVDDGAGENDETKGDEAWPYE